MLNDAPFLIVGFLDEEAVVADGRSADLRPARSLHQGRGQREHRSSELASRHAGTRRPVTYMISSPAMTPAAFKGTVRPPSERRVNILISSHTTCTIAPAPTAKNSVVQTGEYVNAPIHAPSTVGTPAIAPSITSRAMLGRSVAMGARMPSPSVVLCSRKPMIEERAERDRAGGIGGADREAFTEIVQPDADRDERATWNAEVACPAPRLRCPIAASSERSAEHA